MTDRITQLAAKFLNPNRRLRSEHPAKALTPDEREEYAKYLEARGEVKGAASFRNYREEKKK